MGVVMQPHFDDQYVARDARADDGRSSDCSRSRGRGGVELVMSAPLSRIVGQEYILLADGREAVTSEWTAINSFGDRERNSKTFLRPPRSYLPAALTITKIPLFKASGKPAHRDATSSSAGSLGASTRFWGRLGAIPA